MINFEAYQLLESQQIQRIHSKVSVSGISSGAYMASQYHISHSSYVNSATLFAGGPFFCSKANPLIATTECMEDVDGNIDIGFLVKHTKDLGAIGLIDDTEKLEGSSVKIISGLRDFTVRRRVSKSAEHFYQRFNISNIDFIDNLDIAHTFPTLSNGNSCSASSSSPFISSCGIDGAYMALSTSYKSLNYSQEVDEARYYKINQWRLNPLSSLFLEKYAIAFVPKSCERTKCKLHIAFHGCKQTVNDIGDRFFRETGYANWAQESDVIVLYPQAKSTLMNPNGCWDWWGYSGVNFHTKYGPQIRAIDNLVKKVFK